MAYTLENDLNEPLSTHTTYESAVESAHEYAGPDAVVGHDGDLTDHGNRTLVWANEEDAEDDDGTNAVACIRQTQSHPDGCSCGAPDCPEWQQSQELATTN